MTTSGLATPPRAARPRVPEPEVPRPPRRPEHSRTSFEHVLAWSIALSILAHILVLLLSPLFVRVDVPPGATAAPAAPTTDSFGMEIIVAIESENAPEVPPVEEEPIERVIQTPPRFDAERPPTTPAAGDTPPPATPAPGDQTRRSAQDALRPGYRDPRLYVVPDQYPELRRTEHEVYMEHLEARIDALNDSMNVASARDRTTSDWTVTDRDGNKWGLDGDGLHLGGVTVPRAILPLPGPTGDNARLAEERERQRQRDEIQRQEEDRRRRETQDERIDATRGANDAARRNGGS